MPYIQPAKDLYLGPFTNSPAALVAEFLLYTPHQPSDLMLIKLIVPPVGWRQPQLNKPVAAKVMQVKGQFPPKELEN